MAARNTDLAILAVSPIAGFRQATTDEVKAWGRKQEGMKVNDKQGTLSHALVDGFNKANRRRRVQYLPGSPAVAPTEFAFTTASGRASTYSAPLPTVRAWAQENGHTVGSRGRLPQPVIDAYGQQVAKPAKPRKPRPVVEATDSE
jgi:hypothetical protein